VQYAAKGIRANCVLPGLMNTPMIREPLKKFYAGGDIEKMIEIRNQQCPMKKMGDAWDVAYAALFLARLSGFDAREKYFRAKRRVFSRDGEWGEA